MTATHDKHGALLVRTVNAAGDDTAFGASNIGGHGSPMSVVTPDFKWQFYTDVDLPALWQATGTTNTSWIQWI